MGKVKGGNNQQPQMNADDMLKEAEANYPRFTYPPFTNKKARNLIIIVCIVTVIVGLCILSTIISQLPDYKAFISITGGEMTAEQEDEALRHGINALKYLGVGVVILAVITSGAAFLVRKIKFGKEIEAYNNQKKAAFAKWEQDKQAFLQNKKIEIENQIAGNEV